MSNGFFLGGVTEGARAVREGRRQQERIDLEKNRFGLEQEAFAFEKEQAGRKAIQDQIDRIQAPFLAELENLRDNKEEAAVILGNPLMVETLLEGAKEFDAKIEKFGVPFARLTTQVERLIATTPTSQEQAAAGERILPPEEVAKHGFPPGTVVQETASGLNVLSKPAPTPEDIEAESFARKTGEFRAKTEGIAAILQSVNAPPLPTGPDGGEGPAITQPFGTETPASDDAQEVARLFLSARRLFMVGEIGLANSALAQARFIAENSPEIREKRELDAPIDDDLASELGLPRGTPYREVVGLIPRSPEEIKKAGAAAAATGRESVEAEQLLGIMSEAQSMIRTLLTEIEEDPGIVGIRGTLNRTGQTALAVIGDLGLTSLLESARDIAFSDSDLNLDELTELFSNPTLSVLSIIENSVGLILARMRTPNQRIPVDVIKRSISDVRLTGAKGSDQIKNRLNFVLAFFDRREQSIRQQFGFDPADPDIPRFRVTDDGELEAIR